MATLRAGGEAAHQGVPQRILATLNVRALLVVGQIALSTVLLIGAALLVESIAHLRRVDVGFNPSHLLTTRITLPPLRYDTDRKRATFYQDLTQGVEALPGIDSGVAAAVLPMMPQPGTPVQNAAQAPLRLNERPIEEIANVAPGYFRTLEIPLRRGRDFNAQGREDSQRVTIIDENLARQFWPGYPRGLNPVGQRLLIGGIDPEPVQIIGVVGNVHQSLEGNAWPGTVYVPFAQGVTQSAMLAIRTKGDPLRFTRAVREQVSALDRDETIANARTMDALIEAQVGQRRLLMILLESFAGMALLLALIGIYGVISYSAARRTQEVGIRRALGAQQRDVLWLVIREGLSLALAGIIVGLGAAIALTRLLNTLLFGVTATDPLTFAVVALLFLLVGLAAIYIPAHRTSRIDPMAALRM
jgi:predicted permease